MDAFRLKHVIKLYTITTGRGRAEYLKSHNVFRGMGEHCIYMPRKIPLYPNLIKLGNYVDVASDVTFFTHDGVDAIIGDNNEILPTEMRNHFFEESVGCIDIGNHVFIGAGCKIGYNIKVGDNVVITAGSVVANDIPANSVVRGNPAKVICTLTQYLQLKAAKKSYPADMEFIHSKYVGKELADWLWEDFYKNREKK